MNPEIKRMKRGMCNYFQPSAKINTFKAVQAPWIQKYAGNSMSICTLKIYLIALDEQLIDPLLHTLNIGTPEMLKAS